MRFTHLKFLENDQKFFLFPDTRPRIPLLSVILTELFRNVSKITATTGLIPTVRGKKKKEKKIIRWVYTSNDNLFIRDIRMCYNDWHLKYTSYYMLTFDTNLY